MGGGRPDRLASVPAQQLLVFVSGGYTQARFDQIDFTRHWRCDRYTAVAKHTYSGWFIGSGYEYGLGWFPGLFWKTEYRFADYGKERVDLLGPVQPLNGLSFDMHKYVHTVRSELVWRFNPGGPVVAAPVKAPAPAPVVYNWTGCYVGAGGGYGMWNQEMTYVAPPPVGLSNDIGGRGWFGTVQVGCDYQVGSNIVIGAVCRLRLQRHQGRFQQRCFDLAGFPGVAGEEKLKTSWAAGGRIGWLPFQRLLVFVSGGYTQARFDQINFREADNGAPFDAAVAKHTYSGWFLGTGYEYGIGLVPGLFWKTEYRFADYGTERVPIFSPPAGAHAGILVDLAEARPHRAQRAGVALQLRRPGGRALLTDADIPELRKPRPSAGAFAFPGGCGRAGTATSGGGVISGTVAGRSFLRVPGVQTSARAGAGDFLDAPSPLKFGMGDSKMKKLALDRRQPALAGSASAADLVARPR